MVLLGPLNWNPVVHEKSHWVPYFDLVIVQVEGVTSPFRSRGILGQLMAVARKMKMANQITIDTNSYNSFLA